MNLNPVSSIADLVFKAKTNPYYRQLAVLTSKYMGSIDSWRRYRGKEITEKQYDDAIKNLSFYVLPMPKKNLNDVLTCDNVCQTLNDLRYSVMEISVVCVSANEENNVNS